MAEGENAYHPTTSETFSLVYSPVVGRTVELEFHQYVHTVVV